MNFPVKRLITIAAGAAFLFYSLRAAQPNEPRTEYKVIFESIQFPVFERSLNQASATGWKLEKADAIASGGNFYGMAIMSREKH